MKLLSSSPSHLPPPTTDNYLPVLVLYGFTDWIWVYFGIPFSCLSSPHLVLFFNSVAYIWPQPFSLSPPDYGFYSTEEIAREESSWVSCLYCKIDVDLQHKILLRPVSVKIQEKQLIYFHHPFQGFHAILPGCP